MLQRYVDVAWICLLIWRSLSRVGNLLWLFFGIRVTPHIKGERKKTGVILWAGVSATTKKSNTFNLLILDSFGYEVCNFSLWSVRGKHLTLTTGFGSESKCVILTFAITGVSVMAKVE